MKHTKRNKELILLAVIVLALGGASYQLFFYEQKKSATHHSVKTLNTAGRTMCEVPFPDISNRKFSTSGKTEGMNTSDTLKQKIQSTVRTSQKPK